MEAFATADPANLSTHDLLRGRDQVLEQMAWVRQYSLQLIESIPDELWYVAPASAQTHLAWQVGHLAVSQYGLMLFRQRGRLPGDLELMPGWLRKQFGRGSTPALSSQGMPAPAELREKLNTIHHRALSEVAELSAATLAQPTDMPYTGYPIQLGALMFCPIHESLHAGQIGLLRRLHGFDPVR